MGLPPANISVSNAPNVCALGGPFGSVSADAGLGADVGVSGFGGVYHGKPVVGGGISAGAGAGAGVSAGVTDTVVVPLGFGGRKEHCP